MESRFHSLEIITVNSYLCIFLEILYGRVQWLMPEIPALWEANAVGSRGQEIKTILVNLVKPRLY